MTDEGEQVMSVVVAALTLDDVVVEVVDVDVVDVDDGEVVVEVDEVKSAK